MGWEDLVQHWSPCSPRYSQESAPALQFQSINSSVLSLMVQLSHLYMTTEKNIALTIQTFVGKVMSLLSNMVSRFVIPFLPRSKHLLISWLQSSFAVILEPQEKKIYYCFNFFSFYICHDGTECMILVFWMLSFKPALSLSSFTLIKKLFSSSSLSASKSRIILSV